MKARLVAFFAGLLFGTGLCVSGMTQPSKVIGFLDLFGAWDPSLAFVMGGAVAVYAIAFRVARRRAHPWLASAFDLPKPGRIDTRLVAGAVIFGIGWGLSGLCPGPALVSVAALATPTLVFVASMVAGMLAFRLVRI